MQKEQLERYVKQAKGGDPEAFETLYKETYSRAWFVARGVLRGYSQQDWEDVLQEAYYAMLVNLHTYKENTRFNAWVLEIVKNKAVNYAVKHGKQNLKEMELVIDVLADSDSAPRDLYRQRETSEILTQHLEKLPDQQREAIALFYFEDMPIKDIAAKMGVGESTVKTHLRRGKAQLESSLLTQGGKSEVFYSVAVLPLLVSMLNKDIGAGLFTVPQNIIQAAISSTVGAGATTGTAAPTTATGATTTAATGTATATAAPEAAAILAYTEVADAATATTTAAATGGGVVAKFVALGAATKAAIVTGAAAVVVAGVAVPVYVHNENQKAVAAMEIVQQQEEQARQEEQERLKEQARLAEQSRIAEEEAARLEREEQERSAAEEAERREAEAEAERIAAEEEAAQQAAAEESAPAAEEPEQAAAVVPQDEATQQPSAEDGPIIEYPSGNTEVTTESLLKQTNPYAGQSEPSEKPTNWDLYSYQRWNIELGVWECQSVVTGNSVYLSPYGGTYDR